MNAEEQLDLVRTTVWQQKEAKVIVEEILREDVYARNSDLWLILQVWQRKQHIKLFVPFDKLAEMMPAETITRARRIVQNKEKKYLPTDPDVVVKRRIKEETLRAYYGNNPRLLEEFVVRMHGVR